MMDVKEAVRAAKEYVVDLFDGEEIECVGLEEVEFDHESDQWKITIGFSRPWDRPKTLSASLREDPLRRSYKVVCINDADGKAVSVKDRVLTAVG
jgi:hypothetical protein